MVGSSITPVKRLNQYGSKLFTVKKNKLVCKSCNIELDHSKKSSLEQHLKTDLHINNNLKQKSHETSNEFLRNLVLAFSSANIPLHKLNKKPLKTYFDVYLKVY